MIDLSHMSDEELQRAKADARHELVMAQIRTMGPDELIRLIHAIEQERRQLVAELRIENIPLANIPKTGE